MECPKCGEPIRASDRFCSNCGANLENKVNLFLDVKKRAHREVRGLAREKVGEFCSTKLADAAWFIATNTPQNFDYLQGDKIGEDRSFELLAAARESAEMLLNLLIDLRSAYNRGEPYGPFRFDDFSSYVFLIKNGGGGKE